METAQACLTLLSGRKHHVYTSICINRGQDFVRTRVVQSAVKVKRLSAEELAAYLASDEWQGKAGGYAIQGLFAAFIPQVSGSYSAIVGLPLHETYNLLQAAGLNPQGPKSSVET